MPRYRVTNRWEQKSQYIVEADDAGSAGLNWRAGEQVNLQEGGFLQLVEQRVELIRESGEGAPWRKVKTLREDRGMSQRDLAFATGYSGSYLSHIESGRRPMLPGVAQKIADALDVRPEDLG